MISEERVLRCWRNSLSGEHRPSQGVQWVHLHPRAEKIFRRNSQGKIVNAPPSTPSAPPGEARINFYLSHSYSIQHGTDYKIGLRLSVCQCVSLSVCVSVRLRALSRSHFLIVFHNKIGTDVKNLKRKNEFVGGQYRTTRSPFLPHKAPILGQKVLKNHANIK